MSLEMHLQACGMQIESASASVSKKGFYELAKKGFYEFVFICIHGTNNAKQ